MTGDGPSTGDAPKGGALGQTDRRIPLSFVMVKDGADFTVALNAFCERLIGTIRRTCLDFAIPLSERHVRNLLREWIAHYNRGRPHSNLGPGIPDPPLDGLASISSRHQIHEGHRVVATPVLGGLHHKYRLVEPMAA
jgi:Integrase core domain